MKSSAYLGLDLGGTGVKAGVFSARGELLGFGRERYAPDAAGEIPMPVIEEAARRAVRCAVKQARRPVAAMAIVSQGQTFVPLDERDRPLHPAIIWYDSRATSQARQLQRVVRDDTGITTIATVSKIVWLHQHFPAKMKRAHRFLLLPDYFNYRLTGRAVLDANNAGTTGLWSESKRQYSPAVFRAAGISLDQLAVVLSATQPVGTITPQAAKRWGLPAGTPVVTGTNDQYAGALGAGNCRPGILSETSGTCLAQVTLTRQLPRLPAGLYGGNFPIPGYHFVLAFAKTAGLVLDWLRHELAGGASLEALDAAAAQAPIGCRGLTASPHFDGAISPRPDASARGWFAGLTLQHTRADLYRAILESLAFNARENIAAMRRVGLNPRVIRAIGGGAGSDFRLQMKADVTGVPVEQPAVTEAAVLGAAMIAAVGVKQFPSLPAASTAWYRCARVFKLDRRRARQYDAAYRRYLAIQDFQLPPISGSC